MDGRGWHAEHAAEARIHEGVVAAGYGDYGGRLSVQGRIAAGQRPGSHASRWTHAVPGSGRHRGSAGRPGPGEEVTRSEQLWGQGDAGSTCARSVSSCRTFTVYDSGTD